jgi:putative Mn2+ efflux pump MntP
MEYIKKFINWLGEILKETLAQTFTLLGFFIAWLTLTGTAKDIVGIAILISLGLWLLTIGIRNDKPGTDKKKVSR